MALATTLAHSLGRLAHGLTERRAGAGQNLLSQGRRLVGDIKTLLGDRDAKGGEGEGAQDALLASAQHEATTWRDRAEAAEAQVADLEARLAASERTALELRSRVVCLHGKLAATADTLRYQSLTHALDVAGHDAEPLA